MITFADSNFVQLTNGDRIRQETLALTSFQPNQTQSEQGKNEAYNMNRNHQRLFHPFSMTRFSNLQTIGISIAGKLFKNVVFCIFP